MNKSLKKVAQDIPQRKPKGTTPTVDPSGVPVRTKPVVTTPAATPATHAPINSATPTIRDMKIAMQNLADTITRDIASATAPAHPQKADPGSAPKEVSDAKQAFNSFVAELHLGTLSADQQYDIDEMMDNLNSLKSGSKSFKVSDHWDTQNPNDITTQSLKSIVAFIGGLLNLESVGFAGKQTYYTKAQWQQLKDFLNSLSSRKPDQKAQWAKIITDHLKRMTKLYNHYFRDQFLRHEYLRPLIEGHAAFEAYDMPLTGEEQKIIEQGATIQINVPGITNPVFLPLTQLKTPADFSTFLQQIGFTGDANKALISIKRQLGMVK